MKIKIELVPNPDDGCMCEIWIFKGKLKNLVAVVRHDVFINNKTLYNRLRMGKKAEGFLEVI